MKNNCYLKKLLFPVIISLFPINIICQENDIVHKEVSKIIDVESWYIGDFVSIIDGGIEHRELDNMGLVSFMATINFEKAGLWKNGLLTFHFQNTNGELVSTNYIGDLQVFSNIEAPGHTGIFELFYIQNFSKFQFAAGWNDMNAEFINSETGALFLNSSFGIMPGITLNVPVSIFPTTSPFMHVLYDLNLKSKIKFACYAGNPGDPVTNKYNLSWKINKENGLLSIMEYELNPIENNFFTIKVGAYYHSGQFYSFNDTLTEINNYGVYTIIDKTIIPGKSKYNYGLDAFLQFSLAPSDRNLISYYIGTGITHGGFLPKANINDKFGLAVAFAATSKNWNDLSNEYKKYETAIEFSYLLSIKERMSFQPDIQYIINPGAGINGAIDNTLVSTLRFILNY